MSILTKLSVSIFSVRSYISVSYSDRNKTVAQLFPFATTTENVISHKQETVTKKERKVLFSAFVNVYSVPSTCTFWLQAAPQHFLCQRRKKKSAFCCMHISSFRVLPSNCAGRGCDTHVLLPLALTSMAPVAGQWMRKWWQFTWSSAAVVHFTVRVLRQRQRDLLQPRIKWIITALGWRVRWPRREGSVTAAFWRDSRRHGEYFSFRPRKLFTFRSCLDNICRGIVLVSLWSSCNKHSR